MIMKIFKEIKGETCEEFKDDIIRLRIRCEKKDKNEQPKGPLADVLKKFGIPTTSAYWDLKVALWNFLNIQNPVPLKNERKTILERRIDNAAEIVILRNTEGKLLLEILKLPLDITKKNFEEILLKLILEAPDKKFSDLCDEDDESAFPEGRERYSLHRQLERDPKISNLAKRQRLDTTGELRCDICTFSFHEKYGSHGFGYIEAHHTIPISEIKGEYKTKISDIALVCSNCHRMLHRKRPWLTIYNLKDLLK